MGEGPGAVIGRYKLLQKIGEGGCGIVYMAEQEVPVRRRVALKVIKLGMDTKAVVARFEAERQALAMMDHPNIARILDAGVVGEEFEERSRKREDPVQGNGAAGRKSSEPSVLSIPSPNSSLLTSSTTLGRPYFVMELVHGVPITEFCDRNKLPCRERLNLFIQVCQAIQSAHQKGIIHRDIKPSNVLVTIDHGQPTPKVIDFGIAKATDQKLTEMTFFTQFGAFIGTPTYMSPEQAEMTSLDIDTRSDIYSLGVLLYELLTGTTPFTQKRLLSLGYGEMQRVIKEEEPDRPSTRLSTLTNEEKIGVARDRGEEFATVRALLKGDLDWVVMKCLEKDRRRRYDTAAGLAADILRHLNLEPVVARPPSTAYKFQRLIARNRAASIAVAAILLTLIGALSFVTVAYQRERQARRKAASESMRADEVLNFVSGFFDHAIPDLAQRGHLEAIRRLLEVSETLAGRLTNTPATEAALRLRILDAHVNSLSESAASMAQRCLVTEQRARALGAAGHHIEVMARTYRLGHELWERNDEGIRAELVRMAAESENLKPPDNQAAALAFEVLTGWASYRDSARFSEFADHWLRLTPDDAEHQAGLFSCLNLLGAYLASQQKSELSRHPVIQALIDRALQGAPNTRTEIGFSRAWTKFVNDQLLEAEELLEAHRKATNEAYAKEDLLLRATIRARQGRIAEAREDFKIGATMVSAHFRDHSIPFEGSSWHEGVAFELDRRLAEEAIREAVRRGEGR